MRCPPSMTFDGAYDSFHSLNSLSITPTSPTAGTWQALKRTLLVVTQRHDTNNTMSKNIGVDEIHQDYYAEVRRVIK